MTKPIRIQRKRTKGWKMPENTVYVGRPSKWGNPYPVGEESLLQDGRIAHNPNQAVGLFCEWLYESIHGQEMVNDAKKELKGKNLACWCPLDQPCHADVLLEIANRGDK